MSNFTVTYTPGYVWQDGELWTAEKANLAANPTINISGNPGSIVLGAGSVGIVNLQAGMFTADVTGRAPFATGWLSLSLIGTGIFTADASGRAPFANGWLTVPLVATGTFAATTAGRAPFAAGMVNAAMSQPDAYGYAVGGGTGSVYTATFTPLLTSYTSPTISAYWDGLQVVFKAVATCAAGAQLNVDALGNKPIYRKEGTAVLAGDIVNGSIVEVVYNAAMNSGGGAWQLVTPPAQPQLRAGTAIILTSTSSVTVTLSSAMPSTSYTVVITPMVNFSTPISFYVTILSTTQFSITWGGGNVGSPLTFAWIACQNN